MIKIYTDGSCLENPGNGGGAAIIIKNGKKTQIKGNKKNTTNNQMDTIINIGHRYIKTKLKCSVPNARRSRFGISSAKSLSKVELQFVTLL